MTNNIATKQNEKTFLDYLAAQRHLYSDAKRFSLVLFVVCVLFPVLLAIVKLFFIDCSILAKAIVVYSFAATLIRIWLNDLTKSRKVLAARIQQLFDTELFGLSWNKALCGTKPLPEDIHKALKGASYNGLLNWYDPIVSKLTPSVGALVCMRTNIVYDLALRKSYSNLCYVLTFIAIIVVCVFGMVHNTGIWNAFLYGIVPLMPLITWLIDLHKQHRANYNTLSSILPLIEAGFEQVKNNGTVELQTLDEIQNFIYLHRKTSYLIPEVFYRMNRKQNEDAMFYGVSKVIETYHLM